MRPISSVPPLQRDHAFLALAALLALLLIPGDLLSTAIGLNAGHVEANPVVALVLAHASWTGIIVWKLALLVAWLAWAVFARSRGRFGRRVALAATTLFCAIYALVCLANILVNLGPLA